MPHADPSSAVSAGLVLAGVFAALGGFLFGFDLGVIGGALLYLDDAGFARPPTPSDKELIVGACKLGAAFGALIGACLMVRLGRRNVLALNSVPLVAGPILMACSPSVGVVIAGRFIVGLGIGSSAVVAPAYAAEIAPRAWRGAIVCLFEVLLCVGGAAAPLVNYGLRTQPAAWRYMLGLPAAPGLLVALSLLVLPNSPRFQLARGDREAAEQALRRLRPCATSSAEIESELCDEEAELTAETASTGMKMAPRRLEPAAADGGSDVADAETVSAGRAPWCRWPRAFVALGSEGRALTIVLVLAAVNQLCGSMSVINYGPTIILRGGGAGAGAGNRGRALLLSSALNSVKVVGVLGAEFLVDRWGRRPLMVGGGAACGLAMVGLAIGTAWDSPWGQLACIFAFLLSFTLTWAGIWWVLCAELFTWESKPAGAALSTAFLFLCGAAADASYLSLGERLRWGQHLVYAGVAFAGGLFSYACLPETKNRKLAEIHAALKSSWGVKPTESDAERGG